ncbi:MAG: hypothetical protein AAF658_21270, partial [Myxococcota bacterium]
MVASENIAPVARWLTEIAGVVYRCEAGDMGAIELDAKGYYGFWHEDDGRDCNYRVVARASRVEPPARKPDFIAGRSWSYWRDTGLHRFVLRGGHVRPTAEMRLDEAAGTICIDYDPDLVADEAGAIPPFRYPFDALATSLCIHDGVTLHASSAIIDGR